MALNDPRFRPAVRRTLKTIVFTLWTPILLVLGVGIALGVAHGRVTAMIENAKRNAEHNARVVSLQQIDGCARLFVETRCRGDLTRIGEFARSDDSSPTSIAPLPGIEYEIASSASLAPGFDPATTWIARERVPDALAPPLAVFADGHVASLER
jgi:hypothetical protein